MTTEHPPIIDSVPGMAPFDQSQLPNANVVPIAPEDVTPAMMNHAINSPYNRVGGAVLEKPADAAETDAKPAEEVQHVAAKALEGAGVATEDKYAVVGQPGNGLSDFDRQQIRESVSKNIDLTKKYGSINVNAPK